MRDVGVLDESLLGVLEILGGVPGGAMLDQHVLPVDPAVATTGGCRDRVAIGSHVIVIGSRGDDSEISGDWSGCRPE